MEPLWNRHFSRSFTCQSNLHPHSLTASDSKIVRYIRITTIEDSVNEGFSGPMLVDMHFICILNNDTNSARNLI